MKVIKTDPESTEPDGKDAGCRNSEQPPYHPESTEPDGKGAGCRNSEQPPYHPQPWPSSVQVTAGTVHQQSDSTATNPVNMPDLPVNMPDLPVNMPGLIHI